MSKTKKFTMPSSFTILIIITALIAIMTWLVPGGKFEDGIYQAVDIKGFGILDVFYAGMQGFQDSSDLILFIFAIGGFLGIVMETKALEAVVGSFLVSLKGKEHLLIPILMIFFSIGGTTYGMAEETIAFYPILIPIFILAGFDAITGVMVILLGAGMGCLASTLNPFAVGVAVSSANSAAGAVPIAMTAGMTLRIISLIVFNIIAITITMKYALKVKRNKSNSAVADLYDQHLQDAKNSFNIDDVPQFNMRRKIVAVIFFFTFIIMILSVIPWEEFHITVFDNLAKSVLTASGSSFLTVSLPPLGTWWFTELAFLFFVSAILIGFISGMKESSIVDTFLNGSKDLLSVALIIGISRGIKVIMTQSGIDATVLHAAEGVLSGVQGGLFNVLAYLFYLPMSFLVPSTSGLAGATFSIVGPLAAKQATVSGAITAFSFASGVLNLVTPTSGVVMGGLAIAKVPYSTWLRLCVSTVLIVTIVSMILLYVGGAMGWA